MALHGQPTNFLFNTKVTKADEENQFLLRALRVFVLNLMVS